MGVHHGHSLEAVGRMEVFTDPSGERRWLDKVKGRIVSELLMSGVTVDALAMWPDMTATHLSSRWTHAIRPIVAVPGGARLSCRSW